jgi:hypothetical protein
MRWQAVEFRCVVYTKKDRVFLKAQETFVSMQSMNMAGKWSFQYFRFLAKIWRLCI